MSDKKSKKPKSKPIPNSSKDPKFSTDPDSDYNRNPNWRISQIELTDPYGWHILDAKTVMYIKEKLSSFETMTWREILLDSKKQNHSVSINVLSPNAKRRLVEIGQDDIDELISLRLSGKERIWGILDRGTLNLLWWDPEHLVCPSLKKHT
jgi:hypothetical protein